MPPSVMLPTLSLWPASQRIASKRARKIQKRPVVVAGGMNVRGKMTPRTRCSCDKKARRLSDRRALMMFVVFAEKSICSQRFGLVYFSFSLFYAVTSGWHRQLTVFSEQLVQFSGHLDIMSAAGGDWPSVCGLCRLHFLCQRRSHGFRLPCFHLHVIILHP